MDLSPLFLIIIPETQNNIIVFIQTIIPGEIIILGIYSLCLSNLPPSTPRVYIVLLFRVDRVLCKLIKFPSRLLHGVVSGGL